MARGTSAPPAPNPDPVGDLPLSGADHLGGARAPYPAYPRRPPAPAQLVLGTVMPFAQGWSDHPAAAAVHGRLDWQTGGAWR